MKAADWNDCQQNVQVITPDPSRAKSLRETAHQRVQLVKNVTKENCNFVFEDYYTSLLELLQALAFEQGFNIRNHVCVGHFLREVLQREELFPLFDDLRYKRNALTYYGNRMEYATAQEAIEKCQRIIEQLEGKT